MNCRQAQEWLLLSDDPRPQHHGDTEIADHLAHCDLCSRLAEELVRLDHAWREIPLPASETSSREAFVRRLPTSMKPRLLSVRRFAPPRWAIAACLLLAVGMGVWLMLPAPEARASSELV